MNPAAPAIETERLRIVPLTPPQLALWTEDLPRLEAELACRYDAEPVEGLFRDIVRGQAQKAAQAPRDYLWHTFWFLVRKSDAVVVGAIDFKDVPSPVGEVEIGYGLGKPYEHQGYMTEAVRAFCDWALAQPGVRHVIAETDLDGLASQAILRRCGFAPTTRAETAWRL